MESISCPQCGSPQNAGVGGKGRHATTQTNLSLSAHHSAISDGSVRNAVPVLKPDPRGYVRQTGYIRGGRPLPLGDTPLVAHELLHMIDVIARSDRLTNGEQPYIISLLQRIDEGGRLTPNPVPDSMTGVHDLVYVEAIDAYYRGLSTRLDGDPNPKVRVMLGTLSNHHKRVKALDEAVPLSEFEALVEAAREIHTALINNDLDVFTSAHDTLTTLF